MAAQASQTPSTAGLRGVVRDSTGAALSGVEIAVRGHNRIAITNERGQFLIVGIDTGLHLVTARRIGFAMDTLSVHVSAGDTADVTFALRKIVLLPDVDIVVGTAVPARLEGFEHRRANRNGGQFITRDLIERRGSIATADVLRGVQGIQMVDSMGVTIAISTRGAKVNMLSVKRVEACVVRVGVDGNVKDPTFTINTIPPSDIHGIEVYAGAATVPPEFNSTAGRNAQCGLIMIWTRSR